MTVSKKEHILEIAYDSFVDKGYENTNIRQICKVVDVEPPTIYYYFESKKGLFFAVAKSLNERYKESLISQNFLERTMSPDEKLFELFKFNLFYAKNNPKDIKFTLRYDLFPPEEIVEELSDFNISNSVERNEIENKIFDECLKRGIITREQLDSLRKIYGMLVSKYCYYTVLFGYCPSNEEIIKIWEFFVKDKLKKS